MVLLGDEAQVEAWFGPFSKVLLLKQDRYTVCVECTIGSKIVLEAPNWAPRWRGSWNLVLVYLETVLVSVQDRYIIWFAPNDVS
jgi:hypothetical protein